LRLSHRSDHVGLDYRWVFLDFFNQLNFNLRDLLRLFFLYYRCISFTATSLIVIRTVGLGPEWRENFVLGWEHAASLTLWWLLLSRLCWLRRFVVYHAQLFSSHFFRDLIQDININSLSSQD